MIKRIVSIIAVGMVAGAAIFGALVVWENVFGPREFTPAKLSRQPSAPSVAGTRETPVAQAKRASPPAKKAPEKEEPPPPTPIPGAPNFHKQYTLAEADAEMAITRAES